VNPLKLQSGDRFVFLGDSITRAAPGYSRLVASMVNVRHPGTRVDWVYRGVSGNTVLDLVERVERDVLRLNPQWTSVSIGINDVWFRHQGGGGVPLDAFRGAYRTLLTTLNGAGIAVIALTPTVIGERLDEEPNQDLLAYADVIREEARALDVCLADVHAVFRAALHGAQPHPRLTADGIHMNLNGNVLLADTLYHALLA
jgi:lysophospholipase L1-like esterase